MTACYVADGDSLNTSYVIWKKMGNTSEHPLQDLLPPSGFFAAIPTARHKVPGLIRGSMYILNTTSHHSWYIEQQSCPPHGRFGRRMCGLSPNRHGQVCRCGWAPHLSDAYDFYPSIRGSREQPHSVFVTRSPGHGGRRNVLLTMRNLGMKPSPAYSFCFCSIAVRSAFVCGKDDTGDVRSMSFVKPTSSRSWGASLALYGRLNAGCLWKALGTDTWPSVVGYGRYLLSLRLPSKSFQTKNAPHTR